MSITGKILNLLLNCLNLQALMALFTLINPIHQKLKAGEIKSSKIIFRFELTWVCVLIPCLRSFGGNVSVLCWVVLCFMTGALSHALAETIWARLNLSRSLHQDHRLPKPCHTWVQKIKEACSAYNHTAAARAKFPSLLQFLCFQHMCFQGWPLILHLCTLSHLENSLEWQFWKLSPVSLCLWQSDPLWFDQLLAYFSCCLFVCLFVCLFGLAMESHMRREGAWGESVCHLTSPNRDQ